MDSSLLRRLAFVKYLSSIGAAQCRAAEPLASAGLLTLHDAVELFLQLAAERLNVTEKIGDLKDYWKPISAKLPEGEPLSQQAAMQRLNKARVALKHHGTHPSKLDLTSFRATADAFFEENCQVVFGMAFSDVSLSEFVFPKEARAKVDAAHAHKAGNHLDAAAAELAVAFEIMLGNYTHRSRPEHQPSPFQFGPNLTFAKSNLRNAQLNRGSNRAMDSLVDAVAAMQAALRVVAIGLDFRKYSHFKAIVPSVTQTLDGTYHLYDWQEGNRDAEMVQLCIDFVIESAIQLQEFDISA